MGKTKLRIFQFLFALILIVFFGVTLELGLRVYFAYRVGPVLFLYGIQPNKEHPVVSWRHKTYDDRTVRLQENKLPGYSKFFPHQIRQDADETGEFFKPRINNHGFRGEDFEVEKPIGVTRVVTLGASSTFGYHVRDHQTYPVLMEQILNKDCGEKRKFQVLNLGVPHMTSEQNVALFFNEVLALKPDVVTFYEGYNDSERLRTQSPQGLSKYLITFSLLKTFMRELSNEKYDLKEKSFVDRKWRFLGNLDKIHEECQRNGIQFIVGTQQTRSFLVPRNSMRGLTYQQEQEMVQEKAFKEKTLNFYEMSFLGHGVLMAGLVSWAEERQVPLVDILAELDGTRDMLLSAVHVNVEGHKVIAQMFSSKINEVICNP